MRPDRLIQGLDAGRIMSCIAATDGVRLDARAPRGALPADIEDTAMAHPLVDQLRFARSEFVRGLVGVTPDEGILRIGAMNSLGWTVGHLANQEHRYWVRLAQGRDIAPGLSDRVGTGRPASTPPLDEMWAIWRAVTTAADPYLDTLTPAVLGSHFERDGRPVGESIGTLLLRNIHHYWFHTGEAAAIRQSLGHRDLPQFVGDMTAAAYRPEAGADAAATGGDATGGTMTGG